MEHAWLTNIKTIVTEYLKYLVPTFTVATKGIPFRDLFRANINLYYVLKQNYSLSQHINQICLTCGCLAHHHLHDFLK